MRIRIGVAACLLLSMTVAGCGGTDDSNRAASAGNPTSSAEADQLKFAQCMRERGIDMPDPQDGNGKGMISLPEGVDPQKAQAAMQQCKQYLPNGGEPAKMDAQQVDQQRKLARCLRENGVANFPDPGANGGFQIGPGSGLDPNDPTFKAAQKACAKYQPAPPSAGSNP
jgi:hypothetical protein